MSKNLDTTEKYIMKIYHLVTVCFALMTASILSINALAATYTVNTTADAGAGSLRQAILDANDLTPAAADIIAFTGFSGTIVLATALPALTDDQGVTIDGTTSSGYVPNTNATWPGSLNGTITVTIDGGGLLGMITGLTISSDNNIIKGLNFTNVGTTGTTDAMIDITAGANNNQILGCYIGTNSSGTASAGGNTEIGIRITNAANNIIGNGSAAGRNLISGLRNSNSNCTGIHILTSATGNTAKGNILGLQADGATYLATTQGTGARIVGSSTNNTIGGDVTLGEGNLISGNVSWGIELGSNANSILGNIIGPQADGISNVVSNGQDVGIKLTGSASNNIIGNGTTIGRNIISANLDHGIWLNQATCTGNILKGNYIGPGATLANIGSSSQDWGIYLNTSASSNTIGGTIAGEGNVIAFNTLLGIWNSSSTGDFNKISGNPIYSNTGLPIDNAAGANNNKVVPVITTAGTSTIIGTSVAGDIVEVFSNSSGNCNNAETFLGSATADGSGNWSLAVTLTTSDYVLATATDASNNTSEFTTCAGVLPVELLSFTAECLPVLPEATNSWVAIKWETASETNNDYFEIQRAANLKSSGGLEWQTIGIVKGAGNSSTTRHYSFVDTELPSYSTLDIQYYRLKQIDYDGQYEYFPLVAVHCEKYVRPGLSIYPNPCSGYINYIISSREGGKIIIKLTDLLGREILHKEEIIENGVITNKLSTAALAVGSYLLWITNEKQEKVQKQFVVH